MPSFNEDSVEKFFRCFEKVALALKWPEESWVIMGKSVGLGCLNLILR